MISIGDFLTKKEREKNRVRKKTDYIFSKSKSNTIQVVVKNARNIVMMTHK